MDLTTIFKAIAPTAGTLLFGPLGGMAAKFLAEKVGASSATVDAVSTAISDMGQTAEGRVKLAQIDSDLKQHAIDAGVDMARLEVQNASDINKTMQVEAVSEHWPSYSWRPFIGFIFGVTFFGVYFVLPLAKMPVPLIPSEAWLSIGGILGVASWFRGKAQADPGNPLQNKG